MTAPVVVHRGTLIAVYTAILFGSFSYDLFRVVDREAYFTELTRHHYLGYDSYLVLDRLHLTEQGEAATFAPLTEKYRSQFGLQGVVLGLILKLTHVPAIRLAYVAAAAMSLLTALFLAAFFADIAARLGRVSSAIGVVLTAWSPQLVYMASSLYWCTFLLFAPFVLMWLFDPWFSSQRYGVIWRLGLIFLLVFLKCLCGYEFITTVILSPLAAIWFHRAGQPRFLRSFLLHSIGIVAVGILAFVGAMAVHAAQLQYVVGVNGVETIRERAVARTMGEQGSEGTQIPIRKSLRRLPERYAYPASCFLAYFEMPAANTPGYQPALRRSLPIKHCFTFAIVAGVAMFVLRRRISAEAMGLLGASWIGALGSLSWNVLSINHMCIHFHLNCIIFYLPFLPLCFVLAGSILESVLQRVRMSQLAATVQLPAIIGLVILGALLETNHRAARYADYSSARDLVQTALDRAATMEQAGWHYHIDAVREAPGFPAPELDFGSEMNRSRLIQDRGIRGKIGVVTGWFAMPKGSDAGQLQLVVAWKREFRPSDVRFSPRADAVKAVGAGWTAHGFTLVIRSTEADDLTNLRVFAVYRDHVQELTLPPTMVARN